MNLSLALLIALGFIFGSIGSSEAKLSYKTGDLIIGALLPVTKGRQCDELDQQAISLVESFIYGLQKISERQKAFFNVTIGFEISDTCSNPKVAVREAFKFISGKADNSSWTRQREDDSKLVAVVGPETLENIMLTASSLQFTRFPQVIFSGVTRLLGNKGLYSSLVSVVPALRDIVAALAHLIASFPWPSVNVIGSDDIYGREMASLLRLNLRSNNICIATERLIAINKRDTQILEAVKSVQSKPEVQVTVLLARPEMVVQILRESRRRNLTAHVWIGSEAWVNDADVFLTNSDILEGMLTVDYTGNTGNDLYTQITKRLQGISYSDWLKALFPRHTARSQRAGIIDSINLPYNKAQHILDAVSAIGHALELVITNMTRNGETRINPASVRNGITKTLPQLLHGKQTELKILNFQKLSSYAYELIPVGTWTRNHSFEEKLHLDKERIRWPGTDRYNAPSSGPVIRCLPGNYINKEPVCLWVCLRCPRGMFTANHSALVCEQCPDGRVPDPLRTRCLEPEKEFLHVLDAFGVCILSASIVGILITAAVLVIFLKYQNTTVVRASNLGFCLLTLVLLLVWFLSPVLFIGRPKRWICKLRTSCIPLLYTSVSALLLTKTKRLIGIFSALKRNCFLSNYWYSFVACSIILVQVTLCTVYLTLFPSEIHEIQRNNSTISLHCSRNVVLEATSFSYNCLLAIVCAAFAVKSRTLPETYSEAKHICFTMLAFVISWNVYFFGYYYLHGTRKIAVPSLGVIMAAFAVLFFIFIPKIRVIFFCPEKNTKMAALAGTRKYSIDVACGMSITVSKPGKSCLRRHTLATLPAYHEAHIQVTSNVVNDMTRSVSRISGSCLVKTIKDIEDWVKEDSVHIHEEAKSPRATDEKHKKKLRSLSLTC